jgi:hypothetical protein
MLTVEWTVPRLVSIELPDLVLVPCLSLHKLSKLLFAPHSRLVLRLMSQHQRVLNAVISHKYYLSDSFLLILLCPHITFTKCLPGTSVLFRNCFHQILTVDIDTHIFPHPVLFVTICNIPPKLRVQNLPNSACIPRTLVLGKIIMCGMIIDHIQQGCQLSKGHRAMISIFGT